MTTEIDDEVLFKALCEMFPQFDLPSRGDAFSVKHFRHYLIEQKPTGFGNALKLTYQELLYKEKLNEIISDK
jgi:hypothetical protein